MPRRSYFLMPSDRAFLRALRISQDDVTTEDARGDRQR